MVAVDVNAGHLAVAVVAADGTVTGARAEGRERHGNRPSRGRRGRGFLCLVDHCRRGRKFTGAHPAWLAVVQLPA